MILQSWQCTVHVIQGGGVDGWAVLLDVQFNYLKCLWGYCFPGFRSNDTCLSCQMPRAVAVIYGSKMPVVFCSSAYMLN